MRRCADPPVLSIEEEAVGSDGLFVPAATIRCRVTQRTREVARTATRGDAGGTQAHSSTSSDDLSRERRTKRVASAPVMAVSAATIGVRTTT